MIPFSVKLNNLLEATLAHEKMVELRSKSWICERKREYPHHFDIIRMGGGNLCECIATFARTTSDIITLKELLKISKKEFDSWKE